MANFSSGISTFNDSVLNLWTYDLRLSYELCFMFQKVINCETNAMEISVNDEMENGGSLLNHANAGRFSVIAKALHHMGS